MLFFSDIVLDVEQLIYADSRFKVGVL